MQEIIDRCILDIIQASLPNRQRRCLPTPLTRTRRAHRSQQPCPSERSCCPLFCHVSRRTDRSSSPTEAGSSWTLRRSCHCSSERASRARSGTGSDAIADHPDAADLHPIRFSGYRTHRYLLDCGARHPVVSCARR